MATSNIHRDTSVDFELFRSITNSNGDFATWADINHFGLLPLPINTEILGAPFKSLTSITGDNIEFSNITYKYVEWFRSELSGNNKLELNKMVMHLYRDFMAPFEWDYRDRHSAVEWARILAESIEKMMITRQDLNNMMALDEIYKIALCLGNYTIVANANSIIEDAQTGRPDFEAHKIIAIKIIDIQNQKKRIRDKFTRGIDINRYRWVNSPEFANRLLIAQTAGFIGSDTAYLEAKHKNASFKFFGNDFTRSFYLSHDVQMNEFEEIAQGGQVTIHNQGSYTGNLIKPFQFKELFSLGWLPESLQYYGHLFPTREVPKVDNRNEVVLTYAWRAQVAILPIYAKFNHVFITALPNFIAYKTRDGQNTQAFNLNNYNDFVAFKKSVRAEQPMLYSFLIDENGITSDGLNSDAQYAKYIQDRTLVWAGTNGRPITLSLAEEAQFALKQQKATGVNADPAQVGFQRVQRSRRALPDPQQLQETIKADQILNANTSEELERLQEVLDEQKKFVKEAEKQAKKVKKRNDGGL